MLLNYNNEIVTYLQANKILALKLDHALTDVGRTVSNSNHRRGCNPCTVLFILLYC